MSGRNYEGLLDAAHRNNNIGALRRGLGANDIYSAMDKIQVLDEDTQGSGSGSGFSDLSALENETDDFGRRLLQHQRDAARLKAVRGNQQAFRKAIPRPRIADVLDREERQNGLKETDHQRSSSRGSHDSEPPVTVPREWGTKARRQPHWMKKILEPSENGDAEVSNQNAMLSRGTGTGGERDWQDPSKPFPSIERTPRSPQQEQPSTPPSSMRHMNTTLRPSTEADENDFSSNSLIASTPAQTRQPRRIDHLARREMEDLEQHGVTSKALNQMNQLPILPSVSKPEDNPVASRLPRRRLNPERNQENISPRRERNDALNNRGAVRTTEVASRAPLSLNAENSHRTKHKRNDSMNLLRKLARASSSKSPSPTHGRQRDALGEVLNGANNAEALPLSAKSANSDYIAGPQRPLRQDAAALEAGQGRMAASGELLDQSSKGTRSVPDDEVAKTPVVTGAWIDTTLHIDEKSNGVDARSRLEGGIPVPERHVKTEGGIPAVKGEPTVPKSAVSAILRENKDTQKGHFLGDSTVLSLEGIIHPNDDHIDPTITLDEQAINPARDAEQHRPLTQAEKDRRQESLAFEGLNKHLWAARTSIKDASRGLRRVEHTLTNVEDSSVYFPAPADQPIVQSKSGRLGFVHCEICGGSYHSVWSALWAEFRSCFYTWDPSWKYRIRLTPLGLVIAGWFVWYMIETSLCSVYCHPVYASRKTYTPDARAPRFPLVLPTLIFRPLFMWAFGERAYDLMWQGLEAWWHKEVFERFISGGDPCWNLHPAVCRSVEVDGSMYMRPPPRTTVRRAFSSLTATATSRNEWLAAATGIGARVVGSFGDALDDVGSMWDDQMDL